MKYIPSAAIALILLASALLILFSKRNLFDSFISGAFDGMRCAVKLLPTLVIMCTAAAMFTASGAGALITALISPITDFLGIPGELLPFLAVRPISGSASNSVINELFSEYGADSLVGFTASVIAGCSDTVFYIVAVYFSAVNIKNTRYALPVGIISMLVVCVVCAHIARLFVG